jgi:hypothetical protein
MSAILNWYKTPPTDVSNDSEVLPPRVLIHGGSSVKSGSVMQCWGVQYGANPKIKKFELFRRHFRNRSEYSLIDTLPATFGHSKAAAYVAFGQRTPLRTRHSRIVNRTFQFRDELGNKSSDISTSRFGHFELTAVEVDVTGGAAGHIPYAKVRLQGLVKPIKDPLMGLSVLVPDGVVRWTDVTAELGYRNLREMVEAEIADVQVGEGLSAVRSELLRPPSEFGVDVEPRELEIRENEAGSFEMTVQLFGPGTLSFAVQAIPLRKEERLLAASLVDPEDPVDEELLGVMVSDICTISITGSGSVVVS